MTKANEKLERWLVENTGMFGPPATYQERIEDCRKARGEQLAPRRKRFVYKFFYAQNTTEDIFGCWMYIGEHEVDNQEELWDLEKKLEKKYNSSVKFEKVKSLW